jgi:hypothetical protein
LNFQQTFFQSSIDFANVENFGPTFKLLGHVTLLNLLGSTAIVGMRDWLKPGSQDGDRHALNEPISSGYCGLTHCL